MLRRILHLSDLHFGKVNVPALEALRQTVIEQDKAFDLIVVTGDWTQRARRLEFDQAIEFIKELSCPVLSVPGSHDIPLYDLRCRFFSPFARYSKIQDVTLDGFSDDMLSVVGLSTVNPYRPVGGVMPKREVERTTAGFEKSPRELLRIIACHHPVYDPRTSQWLAPERRSRELLQLEPDVVLSGHSHSQWIEQIEIDGHQVLHISAGSTISSRLREHVNSFHILEVRRQEPVVKRRGLEMIIKTYDLRDEGFLERGLPTKQFLF